MMGLATSWQRIAAQACFAIALLANGNVTTAHQASTAFLDVEVAGSGYQGELWLSIIDLHRNLALDLDDSDTISWGEIVASDKRLRSFVRDGFGPTVGQSPCELHFGELLLASRGAEPYIVLPFATPCGFAGADLSLSYNLFFERDPTHRVLAKLSNDGQITTTTVGPDNRVINLKSVSSIAASLHYWRYGLDHVWAGLDHLLFLLTLLLPITVVLSQAHGPVQTRPLRRIGWEAAWVVSAFTLAHSITMALAVLDIVSIPSSIVEPAIAATIVLAALNNLRISARHSRASFAFFLGLIHGFGFAGVLLELDLPMQARAFALLAFNVGVECGQLIVVAVFLPLIYFLARWHDAYRLVIRYASIAAALFGVAWILERTTPWVDQLA